MERTVQIASEAEMLALGNRLGKRLKGGSFAALYGDHGAGKSVLARGVGAALGVTRLTSPTFTIVQEYPTTPPLFHFDAYRLADEDELYAIGFSDYLRADGIVLMEWANLVPGALPKERLEIRIAGAGNAVRFVTLIPHGTDYEELVDTL